MKILFIFLMTVFLFFLKNKEVAHNESLAKDRMLLDGINYFSLYDFLEEDTVRTKEYWQKHSVGMKEMVFVNINKQELGFINLTDTFHQIIRTPISSGIKKSWTPSGEFKILKKKISRPSIKYGGTMTFWNCLTSDERIGIHGLKDRSYESNLGKPKSHGCIRIGDKVARDFYEKVPIGTLVLIN